MGGGGGVAPDNVVGAGGAPGYESSNPLPPPGDSVSFGDVTPSPPVGYNLPPGVIGTPGL